MEGVPEKFYSAMNRPGSDALVFGVGSTLGVTLIIEKYEGEVTLQKH